MIRGIFQSIVMFGLLTGTLSGQDGFVVPAERLSALAPDQPEGYRDLAEELSEIENSKSARDLTIRLYLIAATHSHQKIRRSSLRGLIDAARSKSELQKFKALAFLQDSQFSDLFLPSPLPKSTEKESVGGFELANKPSSKLLDALRSLRQGKFRRANKIMEDQEVQTLLANYETILSVNEFVQACSNENVTNSLLLKIVQLDAKIRQGEKPQTANADQSIVSWRILFKNRIPPRVPKIDLASITEFDPNQSVYRNGVWRDPSK